MSTDTHALVDRMLEICEESRKHVVDAMRTYKDSEKTTDGLTAGIVASRALRIHRVTLEEFANWIKGATKP